MVNLRIKSVEIVGGDEAAVNAILKKLNDTGRFIPCSIKVDSRYASYVEYGTNPPMHKPNPGHPGKHSELMDHIMEWIRGKPQFAVYTMKQRRELAGKIYHGIMEHGTQPHPFIDPAMNEGSQMIRDGYFDDKSHTTVTLAEDITDLMRMYLEENDSYVTGELSRSISVEKSDKGIDKRA